MMHFNAFSMHRLVVAASGTALALACMLPVQAQTSNEVSTAEQLVFNEPHLSNVRPPQALYYRFVKKGELEPAFEDEVQLSLRAGPRGECCSASARFLTGDRKLELPEVELARSNPVILYFLEHDVRDMQRRTKGQSSYFRKRIRLAMVDQARVRDTVVRYGGEELAAREIRVTPYVEDPLRQRFERYAGKEYRFILAKGVPGGIYQIQTVVPGLQPGDLPSLEETMTLAELRSAPPHASDPASGTSR